jgi:hypothetical protein
VLLILLLDTCGIESFIELSPPSNAVKLGDQLSFDKTTANSETAFTGFELYYKFFDSGVTPDLGYIIQFEDLVGGTNPFRRIHASDDDAGTQPPLIYVQPEDRTPGGSPPDNDAFTITVDFTGEPPTLNLVFPFPQIFGDGTPDVDFSQITHTDIRRDVYDGTEYKRFTDFGTGDADISHLSGDIAGGDTVQLVLYAVSYGYDIFSYRRLYSEPVKLGTIQRRFVE